MACDTHLSSFAMIEGRRSLGGVFSGVLAADGVEHVDRGVRPADLRRTFSGVGQSASKARTRSRAFSADKIAALTLSMP